ncbi:MAG TPA: type II toxin-antitoxin system RelE/ParE family toxin [Puia sp.]|nr:type II toxin-antitoxin system RelE/ParE family toxin [Puia sp.]
MAHNLVLKPEVESDIEHAFNWYEDQKEGLGEEFLSELTIYYKKLENTPTAFGKIKKNYRQVALKRFPYVIVFEIIKTEVVIYAVFHTSRNPKNKLKRK